MHFDQIERTNLTSKINSLLISFINNKDVNCYKLALKNGIDSHIKELPHPHPPTNSEVT
ncbi:hypothetical protein A3Q56_04516 [Intoshia linei]|uniref:Uncharacterized protein n=1 Tax=Intoshia linei TaxID=1819745 RepID=A0A177B026_9BILA|nr:hypothetical protein A3Q56_04516 [Intoshia linei]